MAAHGTTTGPADKKRLLSIDGGGLLGLIPAECLIRMEEQLNLMTGSELPLGKRFDLIGGTSTGAIIAAGLCLGWPAKQLRDFYLQFGQEIFTKVFLPLQLWHKYPSGPLENRLKEKFGEKTTLGDNTLLTNLLVVSKNATLGNIWFFNNNPEGKFFATNKDLPLWEVVRASTAAPTFFPPQRMAVPDGLGGSNEYEFIDGGVSTYNNPSFQVFLEATEPSYHFQWPAGTDQLLLISLGTGYTPMTVPLGKAADFTLVQWAQFIVEDLLADANLQQNVLMHLLGEAPPAMRSGMQEMDAAGIQDGTPSAAVLDHVNALLGSKKQLTYQRMTIGLTGERLTALGLSDIDPAKVSQMDAVDQMGNMQRIGRAIAEEQVHMERLRAFFVT